MFLSGAHHTTIVYLLTLGKSTTVMCTNRATIEHRQKQKRCKPLVEHKRPCESFVENCGKSRLDLIKAKLDRAVTKPLQALAISRFTLPLSLRFRLVSMWSKVVFDDLMDDWLSSSFLWLSSVFFNPFCPCLCLLSVCLTVQLSVYLPDCQAFRQHSSVSTCFVFSCSWLTFSSLCVQETRRRKLGERNTH